MFVGDEERGENIRMVRCLKADDSSHDFISQSDLLYAIQHTNFSSAGTTLPVWSKIGGDLNRHSKHED